MDSAWLEKNQAKLKKNIEEVDRFSDTFSEFLDRRDMPRPSAPPSYAQTIVSDQFDDILAREIEQSLTFSSNESASSVCLEKVSPNIITSTTWNLLLQKITELEIRSQIMFQKYTNHNTLNTNEIAQCATQFDVLIETLITIEENDLLPLYNEYMDKYYLFHDDNINLLTSDPVFKQMQLCLNQLTQVSVKVMQCMSLLSDDSYTRVLYLVERLMCKGLVMAEGPGQIIDVTEKFGVKIGFICPSIALNCIKSVAVTLVSEKALQTKLMRNDAHKKSFQEMYVNAKMYLSTKAVEFDRVYKINKSEENNKDYRINFCSDVIPGIYVAELSSMKVEGFNRDDVLTTPTNDKYSFLVQATVNIHGTYIQIMSYSKPIFITSGKVNEISGINEAIIWDTCFLSHDRLPFRIENSVKWENLKTALNYIFVRNVGKGLTNRNLDFLFQKLARNTSTNQGKNDTFLIWRTEFRDQILENCLIEQAFADRSVNPTFFEWFERLMYITSYFLKGVWNNNCVHGFIGKQEAEGLLSKFGMGTFLIRFSETLLGALAIVFVNQKNQVEHLLVKESELRGMEFGKMILSLVQLQWLLTTNGELIRKNIAFVAKPEIQVTSGYKQLHVSVGTEK